MRDSIGEILSLAANAFAVVFLLSVFVLFLVLLFQATTFLSKL